MTTYEDRYRSLGYLFYSIAACDRSIVQEEIDALKEMTARHWLANDDSYDELGIESARYIDIAFDGARAQGMPHHEAYERFEAAQLQEPRRFDNAAKSMILRTAMRIAEAHADVNSDEAMRIRMLERLLARSR